MITNAIASLFQRSGSLPSFRNASLENPQYDLNDPSAYEYLGGDTRSASGVVVTHEKSLSLAAVWESVSLISGDTAKLPCYPYKRLPDDEREIDDKHPSYIPVSVRANKYKAASQFWRDLMVHALLWNNGYAYISRFGNKIELYNLLPDRTAPEWIKVPDNSERGYYYEYVYVTEVDGQLKPLLPSQVLHVRGISLDGKVGADLCKAARDAWGLGLAAQNFISKFFKNGARMGGTLELPAGMTKTARDTAEEGFRKTYEEGDNPFKTVILRESAKFHAGQVTPEQGQVSELRDDQKREVASYFVLPPSKLGIRDSVSYNSFEQDNLSYLWGCLHHWLTAITAECGMKLLSEKELLGDTHYFEHNVSKFMQADWKTLNEGLEILRRNEVINANEWRRKLNLNKRKDPGGEDYVNPNTKSADKESKKDESKQPPKKKDNAAHRELFVDILNRMARRVGHDVRQVAKTPSKFVTWLDCGAIEHRAVFNEAMRPVFKAYASVFGGDSEAMCMTAHQAFFDILIPELSVFVEPPHVQQDLLANVERTMDHFERSAGERVATTIMEQSNDH